MNNNEEKIKVTDANSKNNEKETKINDEECSQISGGIPAPVYSKHDLLNKVSKK